MEPPSSSFIPMKKPYRDLSLLGALCLANVLWAQPQLENAGFEEWDNLGTATEEPVEWSSVKTSDGGAIINGFAPQLCWRDAEGHTGSYSANLRTVSSIAGPAAGLLTNGRVHAELTVANSYVFSDPGDPGWNTVCGSRPDSLIGWFKSMPQPGDHAKIMALMHVGNGKLPMFDTYPNRVGTATWTGPVVEQTEWARFSAPFVYIDDRQPEHVLLAVSCGDSTISIVGTEAWFDDLGLIYNLYAASDEPIAYVSAAAGYDLNVVYTTTGEPVAATDVTVELSDVNGDFITATVIGTINSASDTSIIPCMVPAGTIPGKGYRIRVVTPSPFYAPVPTGIVVELSTDVAAISTPGVMVRAENGALLVDLGPTPLDAPTYRLMDARGALIGSGPLKGQGTDRISAHGAQGVLILRIKHGKGTVVQRVFVP